jgi:hypothetical protein
MERALGDHLVKAEAPFGVTQRRIAVFTAAPDQVGQSELVWFGGGTKAAFLKK